MDEDVSDTIYVQVDMPVRWFEVDYFVEPVRVEAAYGVLFEVPEPDDESGASFV